MTEAKVSEAMDRLDRVIAHAKKEGVNLPNRVLDCLEEIQIREDRFFRVSKSTSARRFLVRRLENDVLRLAGDVVDEVRYLVKKHITFQASRSRQKVA